MLTVPSLTDDSPADRRAAWVFGALTLLCLFAFWATIPLPRTDGQLVGSDGAYYYAYLPSLLLDGDLDLADEYAVLFAFKTVNGGDPVGAPTPTGLASNQFTIGTALLWSPFFLLGHALSLMASALGLAVRTDGLGHLTQAVVLTGSILCGGLAHWLCYRFARRQVTAQPALWSIAGLYLSGNLIYYMTLEPSMSHTCSAMLGAALFCAWQRLGRPLAWHGLVYGAIGGAMALVRPQDGLLLAIPLLAELARALTQRRSRQQHLAQWLGCAAMASATAAVTFSPQLLVWKRLYGAYWGTPYLQAGAPFDWLHPHLCYTMLSPARGLIIWHPMMALGIIGLVVALARGRRTALWALLAIAIQWWVIASWRDYRQGDAFGGRMFIGCTVCFGWGLAELFQWARARAPELTSLLAAPAAAIFIVANGLLLVAYRLYLYRVPSPTWRDVTLGRVLIPLGFLAGLLR